MNRMCKSITLNGEWTVCGAKHAPDGLPARVPGCIHEDLLREGLLEDPFYRDNEKKVQWVGREDWTFSRRFAVDDAILDEARVELVCEGIDTIATVFINEAVVGKTENMHRAYRFDIKPHLRPGENTVTVAIESPLEYVAKRQAVRQMPEWADVDKQNGHGQIRKMACNFGWDWAPMLATSGIWQPIRIEARSTPRIEHVRITQTHHDSRVELQVDTEMSEAAEGTVVIRVDAPGGVSVASMQSDPQSPVTLRIENPELWWPRGLGRQPLYTVTVELRDARGDVLDSRVKRIGLRQLELVREPDAWGESFHFKANGQPFFSKGTTMVPTSPYGTCRDAGRYRVILERAANEHLNLIRVWGGGIYEIDAFYDLCDEMGFVVWQDFMFACSGYPLDEPDFLANVCEEARQQVRRLGHHACIGLWNGNNELELGWSAGWGLVGETFVPGSFGKMEEKVYAKFFDETLRAVSETEAPHTAYWPASPHSPVGDRRESNSERCGDAHIWNVLMGSEPFEFYNKCRNRFVSEYGYQSLPDPGTWDTCLAEGDYNITSPMVDFHQRCHFLGNAALTMNFGRYFRMPKDFGMTCILSQILHGLLIKTAVEEWRRNMPRTMGAINWMLNDVWPGVTNSTIDYLDKPKAAHYLHRQCMNPVLVSGRADPKCGTAEIHLTCDGHPHRRGTFSWFLLHMDGRVLATDGQEVPLTQHKTQCLRTLDFKAQIEDFDPGNLLLFLEILDAHGQLIGDNVLVWCPWKHLNLQPAAITARQDGNHIELSTDKPALWVWLGQPAAGPLLQDNFVHLRPGLTRKLTLLEPETVHRLSPKSMRDTYGT
jgi:beta-mannosidase